MQKVLLRLTHSTFALLFIFSIALQIEVMEFDHVCAAADRISTDTGVGPYRPTYVAQVPVTEQLPRR